MSKQNSSRYSSDSAPSRQLRPIAGGSGDIGLVVRQSDFLQALEAPDVRETLACANEILSSPDFPPDEPQSPSL